MVSLSFDHKRASKEKGYTKTTEGTSGHQEGHQRKVVKKLLKPEGTLQRSFVDLYLQLLEELLLKYFMRVISLGALSLILNVAGQKNRFRLI